jgi:hypothetical protein
MYVYKYETMWMTSMRRCGCLVLCIENMCECLSTMWITSILKYGVCLWTLMYDVYVVCGFSCVDDIVNVVINILYVSI